MATIVGLFVYPEEGAPPSPLDRAAAGPGRGLDGDRHKRPKRRILMVDRSVLDDHNLAPGALREQLTVEGLPELNTLSPGTRIASGTGILEVIDSCAPCLVIGEYNGVEDRETFRQSLEGRRGMFVEFLEPAEIAVGDEVRVL